MARMLLTNNMLMFKSALKKIVYSGFGDYDEKSFGNIFLSVHKKKKIKIDNFEAFPEDDFCSVIGTCIYKAQIGKEALKSIYADFNGDIETLRKNMIGNFLVCIKKYGKIFIFVDKYQIYRAYYFNMNSTWFVSNSLSETGIAIPECRIDEFPFIEATLLSGPIGIKTIFQNVFRLFGHQIIVIDPQNLSFMVNEIPYVRRRMDFSEVTIESCVAQYAEKVKNAFASVYNAFGDNILIHQTGGLDNRTVFSGFMSVGCKPRIAYGIGNSIVTNTKSQDQEICKEYARKFGLDLHLMNWSNDYSDYKNLWKKLFERYGFYFNIYGGNENFFSEYESMTNYPSFMECGYFGEHLRLREWAQDSGKDCFTVSEFIEGYILGAGDTNLTANKDAYPNYSKLKEYLIEELSTLTKLYSIDIKSGIPIDKFEEVRWIFSRNSDSQMLNFLNDFSPSIAIFSLPELHEFPFDVPAAWKANARFQLMLIDSLCPEVLEIPFFTHCHSHKLNKTSFTLEPNFSVASIARRLLKNIGLNESSLKSIAILYHKITCNNQKNRINKDRLSLSKFLFKVIKEIENKTETGNFLVTDLFNQNVVYLMVYAQYLFGYNEIMLAASKVNSDLNC